MATETNTSVYSGVEGVVTYGGNPFAHVSFDIELSRGKIAVPRGGKFSDISLPGKVDFKGKIKYGLVDADLLFDALDDGTNTSTTTDEALHGAIAGSGSEQLINTVLTNPSVPMTLKLKVISTDGYSAGSVIVNGTDANSKVISESIPFILQATGSTTVYYYGSQKFKTITSIVVPAVLSSNDTVTPYGAGQKTATLSMPKYVTITGKYMKSATSYVEITLTNCWLAKMTMALGDAGTAEMPEQDFYVLDPDADISLVEAT